MGCFTSKTAKDGDNELEELDIKKTKVEELDTLFENASAPLNEAVGVKEKIDEALAALKKLAGFTEDDSLKDIFLGLKERIPNLRLEFGPGDKFQLTTGTGYAEDMADIADKLCDAVSAISELVNQIKSLVETAVESAEGIIEQAEQFEETVQNADLNPLQIPKALKNTLHNVTEFGKVADIVKAFKQMIEDMIAEIKETIEALETKN